MESEKMVWNWCFWQRESSSALAGSALSAAEAEPVGVEGWEARLVEAGVSNELAPALAEKLLGGYAELGRGSSVALIEGAAVAVELQAAAQADVERNMRDVREVERLLGAFSGELEKLDEVLEVLAAYAQRMRSKPAKTVRRVLH